MMTEPNAAFTSQIEQTLLAYAKQHDLFPAGGKVIAACSGGADSMALLLFLLRCRQHLRIELAVAHVDHGIRGAEAGRDAAFVETFCRARALPFFLFDARRQGIQVPPHASEDWARRLRYTWFDALAQGEHALVATAHTMNDQAETVLFRLARGAGVRGMAGIRPKRGPYIRPCLCLLRSQTEAYCTALGQSYVQDSSNADMTYARNRIRGQVLPALAEINPTAITNLARYATQMQALDTELQRQAKDLLAAAQGQRGYALAALQKAAEPVLGVALHQLLPKDCRLEERHIRLLTAMLKKEHGAVQINARWRFAVRDGELLCEAIPAAIPQPEPAPPQRALPGKYTLPGGYILELLVMTRQKYEKFIKNALKFKKDLNCCADYDKIDKDFWVRVRQPGDRYHPPGRGGHKTLKKYYNEQAVPAAQRAFLPLLANGHEVLWLWNSGFAEGLAPTAQTQTVLVVCQRAEPESEQDKIR